jgi:hypothetical protein
VLYPEAEARPHANFQRVDLLEPNTLEAGIVKETAPGAEEHRHDVDPELVDELRIQQLLGDASPYRRTDIPRGIMRVHSGKDRRREAQALPAAGSRISIQAQPSKVATRNG